MDEKLNSSGSARIVRKSEDDRSRDARIYNGLKEQLEWIKRQIDYATFTDENKLRMKICKGEIFEIDWGINVNAEFSNRHYGVALRDSSEYDPLVLMCPLKSNRRGGHPMSDIDLGFIEALGSDHPTLAVINQVRTLDKVRIFSRSAISEQDLFRGKSLMLEPQKLDRILTAYMNYVKGYFI